MAEPVFQHNFIYKNRSAQFADSWSTPILKHDQADILFLSIRMKVHINSLNLTGTGEERKHLRVQRKKSICIYTVSYTVRQVIYMCHVT